MDLNKVQLIGRLTRDPETRNTQSGQMVATFSVATSREWRDQQSGEKKSQTEFHNVVAWRKLAEIVSQYMKKGRQIYVEGYLQTRSWDDPSGQKRYRTEIVADNIIMLGSSSGGGQSQQGGNQGGGYSGGGYQQPAQQGPAQGGQMNTPQPQPQGNQDDMISIEDIPF